MCAKSVESVNKVLCTSMTVFHNFRMALPCLQTYRHDRDLVTHSCILDRSTDCPDCRPPDSDLSWCMSVGLVRSIPYVAHKLNMI